MKASFITIFLFFSCNILFAQEADSWKLELIKSLSKYRSNLLKIEQNDLRDFITTLNKWKELEPNNIVLNDIIFQSQYAYSIGEYSFKSIAKSAKEKYPNSKLSHNFTEDELKSIIKNSELADLITWNIINSEYPYKISSDAWFFNEIEFYEIKNDETIAEIGAGKGIFSFLISMTGKNPKIYINEINDNLLNYIKYHFSKNNLDIDLEKTILIKGGKKGINIPEKVDKIIIRKSLHHFSKKEKMLTSIKETLKDNGDLYIYEPLKNKSTTCSQALSGFEIKSILNKNGFTLIKELKLEGSILLKYQKSKLIK